MSELLERIEAALPGRLRPGLRLVVRTVQDVIDDRVPGLAAEAAFFALLSLAPLLLAILGTVGFVVSSLDPDAVDEVRSIVIGIPRSFLSADTGDAYQRIATDILSTGATAVVSFGFIVAVWVGSRAVRVYLDAVIIAYDIEDPRSGWQRRALALGLTLAGTAVGAVVVPMMVFGPDIVAFVLPDLFDPTTSETVRDLTFYLALGAVVIAGLATFYHVVVPWRTPWRRDLPGAVVAMIGLLLGGAGLRAYIAFSFRDASVYGNLATPLAVMLWMYVMAFSVLVGAELNAEIEKQWPHELTPDEIVGKTPAQMEV